MIQGESWNHRGKTKYVRFIKPLIYVWLGLTSAPEN